MTRILVVDDHPLFREGLAHLMRTARPGWTLAFVGSAADACCHLQTQGADLAIIDIGLPDDDGFVLLGQFRALRPDLPQILISGRDDGAVRVRARSVGARGFIAKTMLPDSILLAIDAVLAGGTAFDGAAREGMPSLTPRQAEVLDLLAQGHGNKEIRHRLGIAERTVRAHLTDLFQALDAHSRMQALIRARELGLIA